MLKVRSVEMKQEPIADLSLERCEKTGNLLVCVERTDEGSPNKSKFVLGHINKDGFARATGLCPKTFDGLFKLESTSNGHRIALVS